MELSSLLPWGSIRGLQLSRAGKNTVKFVQLLFGTDVRYENYSDRVPVSSNESFLLFAKEACKVSGIKKYEMLKRGNHSNPLKLQQMLFRHKQVHYVTCQVTRSPCGRRNVFGTDAHQDVRPTPSALWKAGSRCGELLDQTLKTNFAAFGTQAVRPSWLMKLGRYGTRMTTVRAMGLNHTWEIQLRHFLLAVVVF